MHKKHILSVLSACMAVSQKMSTVLLLFFFLESSVHISPDKSPQISVRNILRRNSPCKVWAVNSFLGFIS